jgi:hypothetical protein
MPKAVQEANESPLPKVVTVTATATATATAEESRQTNQRAWHVQSGHRI